MGTRALRYQRCRVTPVEIKLDPFYHYAWIPVDRVEFNKEIVLKFPDTVEQAYRIAGIDDLIVDGWLLPFLEKSIHD